MAHMSQEHKKRLAPKIKEICKKYGVKATISVTNHSTLCLNIKSSSIDFLGEFNKSGRKLDISMPARESDLQVSPYWYKTRFSGKALQFLSEIFPAMNEGNWNRSDSQSDYFDVGWYVEVNIGQWNAPYCLIA